MLSGQRTGLFIVLENNITKETKETVVVKYIENEYLCLKWIKDMQNGEYISHIVSEIEKLDCKGKVNVLSEIVDLLKEEGKNSQPTSITNLKGLGKKIWQQADINSYLTTERESWE